MFPLHPALRGVLNLLITAVWCHLQYFSYIEVVSFIVGETGEPVENHWPVASYWQTLSHDAVSTTVENSKNNAGLLVNSSKIKRQIWISKTYFWFICIRHCIYTTRNLDRRFFSGRVSFTRSPENIPIEIMLWFEKQDNPKWNFPFNKNYMHRRPIVVWTQRNGTHSEVVNKPQCPLIAADLL